MKAKKRPRSKPVEIEPPKCEWWAVSEIGGFPFHGHVYNDKVATGTRLCRNNGNLTRSHQWAKRATDR